MNEQKKEDRLLDHGYDGIQEYDNPLPGWWVYGFWATIIFSVLYFINVPGIGTGKGRIANYEAEMAQARARAEELAAKTPSPQVDDASLIALSRDEEKMNATKTKWMNNCFACHLEDGGGQIGPNLTDDYWIHGGRPTDIHRTIRDGILEKGMPAWGKVMSPGDVAALSAYVERMRGTQPKTPKAPQGVKYEP